MEEHTIMGFTLSHPRLGVHNLRPMSHQFAARRGIDSVIATSVFALTFLLIGVPLWWKTTEVYRYPIPYGECQSLLSENIKHSVAIKLIIEDRDVPQGLLWEELLKISDDPVKESRQPSFSFQWSMSSVSEEEHQLINKCHTISELDATLQHHETSARNVLKKDYGQLKILVLSQNYTNALKYTVGTARQGYILNNESPKNLAQSINFLAKKMVQVERLQKLYTPASSYGGDKIPDRDRMRYLRSTKNFDITFSLIVPEPQVLEVHWNIERAINAYMRDVIKDIELISTVKVKSQVLYMTSLHIPTHYSASGKEFIVKSEDLPSLINPIESKLGSETSVHPNLNFVVYIPTRDQTPLKIHDPEGRPVQSNAFLLPQWGGFMMYNCPVPENASLPHPVDLNIQTYMEIFLSQFRMLLSLPDGEDLLDESIQMILGPVIHKWELDFLLRKNAQEQLAASISSLSSLSQLLQTIENIVIRNDVGEKIHYAVSSTRRSLKLLSDGHLLEGFLQAQSAFVASDEAFFDPSLLALLYFPEDQKYAIYIPLFLPISIPVITSLRHLWKYWRDSRQKPKSD